MSTVQVIPGLSLLNRCLLYTSAALALPQGIAGWESYIPINIGFLAYNWYNQIIWYQGIKAKQLHALCLVIPHLNLTFAITYFGGMTAANLYVSALLVLGTMGIIVLNTVAAWTSWATNQKEGFGVYQFFFYGWRTLGPHWHQFFLVWQIFDTLFVLAMVTLAIIIIIAIIRGEAEVSKPAWYHRYVAILAGAFISPFVIGPLILWTELIVARNHTESATDWIAVWLFVAQVGALLIPFESVFLKCLRMRD